jgi:1,4-dihydroxy-2-naphthoate octaprenyltransferase
MTSVQAVNVRDKSKAWITLARLPFHTVGVLPFTLGAVLAWRDTDFFHWGLWVWGVLAVVLIMFATYLAGECFDQKEDIISGELGRSRFAGGTGVPETGIVSRETLFMTGVLSLVLAGVVGLIIRFGYGTGPWTIPLGMLGMIGGFLYSTPPVRWVSTGFGELWIGFCYGLLPTAAAYYLPTGRFDPLVFAVSVPIAATIFNVILANEYPDFVADERTGKRNLLQRIGRERGALLYLVVSAVGWVGVILSVFAGVPHAVLAYYSVPFAASVYVSAGLLRRKYRDRASLEVMCGLGILVNLGTTSAYILAFLFH